MKVIMNPPYCRNLHLKILSEVLKHFDDVVNLSPIRWLQDPLAEYKKSSDWKKFSEVRDKIESIDIISFKKACKLFGARLFANLGIYKMGTNGHIDLRDHIALKVYNSGDVYTSLDVDKKDGWRVRVSLVDGARSKGGTGMQRLIAFYNGMKDGKPWYEHFGKCGWSKKTDYMQLSVPFNNEAEANNFISVMKSKLGVYYWQAIHKEMKVHPYCFLRLDFSHPWTDQQLYEHYNLTPSEVQTVEEKIK